MLLIFYTCFLFFSSLQYFSFKWIYRYYKTFLFDKIGINIILKKEIIIILVSLLYKIKFELLYKNEHKKWHFEIELLVNSLFKLMYFQSIYTLKYHNY